MEFPFQSKYIFSFVIFTFSIVGFSSIVKDVHSQTVVPNNDFFCSDGFCPEWLRQNPCSTNASSCNTTGFREFLDPDRCNCCNYCFDYLNESATCSPHSLEKPVEMCGPFLECRADTNKDTASCRPIGRDSKDPVTSCLSDREEYLTDKKGIVQFLPDCDAHGYFSPRQCLPGSLCYCSDRNGKRIFGESQSKEPQDCACARDVARLQEFGFQGKFPHCLPNGDYDELQCVIPNRSCFCKSSPAKVYYPQNINKMACFDSKIHPFDEIEHRYYNKECESRRAELEVQRLEAEINGTLMVISDLPTCSPDGNYDRIQASKYDLYCSDRDGNPIEDFKARKFSKAAKTMNCYCARARHMLSESATGKPKCCPNGNYRPWQCVGSTCYCVDCLGRQIINESPFEVSDDKVDTLPCVKAAKDKDSVCDYDNGCNEEV